MKRIWAAAAAIVIGLGLTAPAVGGDKKGGRGRVAGPQVKLPSVRVGAPQIAVSTPQVVVNQGAVIVQSPAVRAGASAVAIARGGAARDVPFIVGGGGAFFSSTAPQPTAVSGLSVVESFERREEKSRSVVDMVVLQAICVDDSGTPHPASRLDPEELVDPMFEGELFRCIAGTHMRVTLARMVDGEILEDGAPTLTCEKGEALVQVKGGGVQCAAQRPERDCNERSLLRRFGPGVKVVKVARQEQYEETVQEERTLNGSLVLDGGVGGTPF
ncbi:MAG: hypothetical protein ACFB2Z_03735 [Maricaulaceae bacterium]